MSSYALFRHYDVLEIIATCKFPRCLPHCAQNAVTVTVTEGIWRRGRQVHWVPPRVARLLEIFSRTFCRFVIIAIFIYAYFEYTVFLYMAM